MPMHTPDKASWPRVELSITRNADHPFIFRKMCRPADHAPGTIVEVIDNAGRLVGTGIYNRKSQIAVRLLSQDPSVPATDEWIKARLAAAISMRRDWLKLDKITDAYRLVHAEGDGLSGLIADRFGPFVVLELFSAGWFRKLGQLLKWFAELLDDKGSRAPTVLVRADDETERLEGFRVRDFVAEKMNDVELQPIIREGPCRFRVDLRHGHKTGYFCDQRDNRRWVAELSHGKRMLDAFCYTGGFACQALAAGAKSAVAVDLDERALDLAQQNAKLCHVESRFQARHGDVFDVLRAMGKAGEKFDVIVLDPPKLAAHKDELDKGLRAYGDLSRLALPLLNPGGVLVSCSCSGVVSETALQSAVRRASSDANVPLQVFHFGGAGADHPIAFSFPEGRYLKAIFSRRLG